MANLLYQASIVLAPTAYDDGKVVKIPATYDADGNIITPAVYYDGYAIDVMNAKPDLDFGAFMVYPVEAAHSFYGYPRNAEVPPTNE